MANEVKAKAKFTDRVKRELTLWGTMGKGYNRVSASRWYHATNRDFELWQDVYSQKELQNAHARGFLGKSLAQLESMQRISDLDYLYLRPYNNSFSKWIEDINTMVRMHPKLREHLPQIYFSIVNRNGLKILDFPFATRKCDVRHIMDALKEAGQPLQLRPAFWQSKDTRYDISYVDDWSVRVEGKLYTRQEFYGFLSRQNGNYLLCTKPRFDYPVEEGWDKKAFYKFYMINDCNGSRIACALAEIFGDNDGDTQQYLIDRTNGTFCMDGRQIAIPNWELVSGRVLDMAREMLQLDYFTTSVVLTEGGFLFQNFNYTPILPRIPFDQELNDYLLDRLEKKKAIKIPFSAKWKSLWDKVFAKFVGRFCRPGIRPYMQGLWFKAVWDDFKWKGTNLKQKIWAWKRGFLSYRIDQYGLTEENYATMLSDYDYHWLNRLNNIYQVWISDKTTFRYTMEPMKQYIPDYYYSIFKKDGQLVVSPMQDIPEGFGPALDDVLRLLQQEKILVFKPSAGLHGDGFYCLEWKEDSFWVNGKPIEAEALKELICQQRSVYVVTSYIFMHSELKKIYPTSVNSIRVMAINRHGYDPAILQTYMRIGSSKTGYTDNVGYGGICAMIDIPSGTLYDPESLRDHVYYPCPQHPDTGTEIAGITIPHWPVICEKVAQICQLFPELEYLGFDVAVTEDSFQIMEINVHQDLHKVARHAEEVREFYRERIRYKKRLNGIPE